MIFKSLIKKLMKGLLKVSFVYRKILIFISKLFLYQYFTIFLLKFNIKNGTLDLIIKVDKKSDKIFII